MSKTQEKIATKHTSNQTKNFDYEICHPSLSVQAMRSSGYRDAAHAIAELVDNSIQAGVAVRKKTDVEVLCEVKEEYAAERNVQRIQEIAVYDNGSGMSPEVMRIALQFGNGTHLEESSNGMGKFGMGLPNSSVSQCKHVDVYSWKKSKCFHTYLDLDEILNNSMRIVPEPKPATIPEKWKKMISSPIEENGTLVIWSNLDRLKWRTPKAFFENSEFIIGRMHRYFIQEGNAQIRFAAYVKRGSVWSPVEGVETYVRPNDPMYLMEKTSTPAPFDNRAAFVLKHEDTDIKVSINGRIHVVRLRYSICTQEARDIGGFAELGKHAAKNVGVSLVREKRELEMDKSFVNQHDSRERWWGCEVHFDAALDDIFGVTNTKQAATNFKSMDLKEDAKSYNMTESAYLNYLKELDDPRVLIYQISEKITKALSEIRTHVDKMGKKKEAGEGVPASGSPEAIASQAARIRREQLGKESSSDKDAKDPEDKRIEDLTHELAGITNVTSDEARPIATKIIQLKPDIKFLFENAEMPGNAIFDIKSKAGVLIIIINSKHPASGHLFELLEASPQDDQKSEALQALKLMLMAWARLEDEASLETRQQYEDVRQDWGRIARDFIKISEQ